MIEYNVRMGDPETEAVLPRIESDFLDLLHGIGTGTLDSYELKISPDYATTVVMVSGGYPGSYEKGKVIALPESVVGAEIFHAGTGRNAKGELVNQGGRVIAVTGRGESLQEALSNAFTTVKGITWDQAYYRKDIGMDILNLM